MIPRSQEATRSDIYTQQKNDPELLKTRNDRTRGPGPSSYVPRNRRIRDPRNRQSRRSRNPAITETKPPVEYVRRIEAVGSETLAQLIADAARAGRPVRVLVYDSHLPWARRVAREAGVAAAAFLTQMCTVDLIYGEVYAGRVALPLIDGNALGGRLGVELGPEDVPPFVTAPEWYPAFTESALGQFDGLEDADDVLVDSFRDLEPKVQQH